MYNHGWNLCIYIIAFSYSSLAGTFFINPIMQLIWKNLQKSHPKDYVNAPDYWQGGILGIVERILFIVSLQMDHPEFIAIWFTLKTVSLSKSWADQATGRSIFNNFLIGNALSLLFALASYGFIWLGNRGNETEIAIILAGPVTLSAIIIVYLRIRRGPISPRSRQKR